LRFLSRHAAFPGGVRDLVARLLRHIIAMAQRAHFAQRSTLRLFARAAAFPSL
jgi:hypothetical protein